MPTTMRNLDAKKENQSNSPEGWDVNKFAMLAGGVTLTVKDISLWHPTITCYLPVVKCSTESILRASLEG